MTDHDWTAVPMGNEGGIGSTYGGYDLGLTDTPRDPLPWSEEVNDLYVRLAQCSWDDLIRPDGRAPLAEEALRWFESGATVDMGRPDGQRISLYEVWDWPSDRVIRAARARYENRAALWRVKRTRANA